MQKIKKLLLIVVGKESYPKKKQILIVIYFRSISYIVESPILCVEFQRYLDDTFLDSLFSKIFSITLIVRFLIPFFLFVFPTYYLFPFLFRPIIESIRGLIYNSNFSIQLMNKLFPYVRLYSLIFDI